MSKDINLLPDIALEEERQQKLKKLFTLVGILILLLTIVVVIVVFSIQLFLQNEKNNLVEVNNQLRNNIISFQELELNYRSLKSKANAITAIRSESKNFETYLAKLIELLPDGVSLTTVSISDSNILTTSGDASDSTSVREMITNIIADEKQAEGVFVDVNMNSLSLSQDGRFQFSITMAIKE